jgi:hypothetical protein
VPAGCPTEAIAASIARHYALGPIDCAAVREAHEEAIGTMANAFGETLGEKARAMRFERLVGALVTPAWNAGRFFSDKVTEARALTAKLHNDDRDEDSEGVWVSRAGRSAPTVSPPRWACGLRPVGGGGGRRHMPARPSPARPGNRMPGWTTTRCSADRPRVAELKVFGE